MARSIKSKRGKMLRRVLRERYKNKSEAHLNKIVEQAKKNDLNTIAKVVRRRGSKLTEEVKAENEMEVQNEKSDDVEVLSTEVSEVTDVKSEDNAEEDVKPKTEKRMRLNLKNLRDKSGKLPVWVPQRQLKKAFFKRISKNKAKKSKRGLKLF